MRKEEEESKVDKLEKRKWTNWFGLFSMLTNNWFKKKSKKGSEESGNEERGDITPVNRGTKRHRVLTSDKKIKVPLNRRRSSQLVPRGSNFLGVNGNHADKYRSMTPSLGPLPLLKVTRPPPPLRLDKLGGAESGRDSNKEENKEKKMFSSTVLNKKESRPLMSKSDREKRYEEIKARRLDALRPIKNNSQNNRDANLDDPIGNKSSPKENQGSEYQPSEENSNSLAHFISFNKIKLLSFFSFFSVWAKF